MSDIFAKAVAALRYLFIVAVLILAALAIASLGRGVLAAFDLVAARGGDLFRDPLSGPVPHFVRAAFLYFLAVAMCFLFVGEVPAPQWMAVRNLFHLRSKVLTFLTIIMPLYFLGKMAHGDMEPRGILYLGGGVFLVMASIYLFLRHGSPSGDEAMSREGNRPPQARPREEERQRGEFRQRVKGAPPAVKATEDRQEQQKGSMKFQKETLPGAESDKDRNGSHVTVKPGPRRPFRRRGR